MTTTHEPESELSRLMKPLQPYIEKYGSKVVLGLAVVLLVAAGYIWWSRTSQSAAAAGWGDIATSTAPEDFADVADQNPGTAAAAWARLAEADGYMNTAVRLSFTDRTASAGTFKKAETAYEKLLNKRGTPKNVRERALFGMARLLESTSGDDTTAAIAAYEKLLSEFPESIYKEVADKRIVELKKPEVQKFYGWFASQKPSVADDLRLPNDLLPDTPSPDKTGVPPLDSILSDDPVPGDVEPGEGSSVPAAPALPKPETPSAEGASPPANPSEGDTGKSDETPTKTDGGAEAKTAEEKSSDEE